MKLHQKAYLLVELSKTSNIWDYELIEKTLKHYDEHDDFREKSLRIALDELASAGLTKLVNQQFSNGQLLFCYELSEFGRARMLDTGLLTT
jgi:hypothetical protein